jgi:asparagine synthase (glutamine-hydrolysing)
MCGIVGIIPRDGFRRPAREEIDLMVETLHHRGPDDTGSVTLPGAALGLKRLSIIDVAGGRQPIANEDGNVTFVGNGEIYNYRELREELIDKGHRFATGSDMEVVVHGYESWGDSVASRLNGQFAFALWDGPRKRLLAARDRAGEKPFYYYQGPQDIFFASEIKALLVRDDVPRQLDLEGLDTFLTYEFIIAPHTIFQGIRKLPAAHILTVEGGSITTRRYWDVPSEVDRDRSEQEWVEELRGTLARAVEAQMMSDVPLGAFLSGGIDSSSVVAYMSRASKRPVKTFSISFQEGSYDESSYARQVSELFGTEHHEERIDPQVVDLFDKLVVHLDEPFADVSYFPTYLVSQVAAREVKVVLSGDGGDELFAGYDWYVADRICRSLDRFPGRAALRTLAAWSEVFPPSEKKKGLINKAKRFLTGATASPNLEHYRWLWYLNPEDKLDLYTDDFIAGIRSFDPGLPVVQALGELNGDLLNRQLHADFKIFLADDILVKVDRMSMATSLEARAPFLDRDVIELAFRMPGSMKLKGVTRKHILKQAMKGILPESILYRRKEGFSIPMKNWLRGELRPLMLELLSEDCIRRRGLFRWPAVERHISEHLEGRANHAHRLFPLMVFERWAQEFLDGFTRKGSARTTETQPCESNL